MQEKWPQMEIRCTQINPFFVCVHLIFYLTSASSVEPWQICLSWHWQFGLDERGLVGAREEARGVDGYGDSGHFGHLAVGEAEVPAVIGTDGAAVFDVAAGNVVAGMRAGAV